MSPVHLAVLGEDPARVPIVEDPFWIGRDPGCNLCLWDLRVSRKHAKVSQSRGEYLISSEGKHGVYVNGKRVPFITLRNGDEISLTPPGEASPIRLRFENALEGTFVPPGGSISAAWVERVRVDDAEPALVARYETLGVLGAEASVPLRLVRERATGREGLLSVFPPVPVGAPADAWLRLVGVLAGAEHPQLARVVDGGIEPVEEGAMRWLVTLLVRGRPASVRIQEGPQAAITVVRRLRGLAAGLHLLHSRGVVHGSVVPTHVILRSDGGVVLAGYGRSFLRRDGTFATQSAAVGTAPIADGFVAPEVAAPTGRLASPAADVYGLCAVGLGLLLGHAPTPVAPGAAVPEAPAEGGAPALEEALRRGLDPEPSERPSAEDLGQVLAFVEASLSRPGGA